MLDLFRRAAMTIGVWVVCLLFAASLRWILPTWAYVLLWLGCGIYLSITFSRSLLFCRDYPQHPKPSACNG